MSKMNQLIIALWISFCVPQVFANPSLLFTDRPQMKTFELEDLVDFEQGVGVYFGFLYRHTYADGPLTQLCQRLGFDTYVKNSLEVQKIAATRNNEFQIDATQYSYSIHTKRLKEKDQGNSFTLKYLWMGGNEYLASSDRRRSFLPSQKVNTIVSQISCSKK